MSGAMTGRYAGTWFINLLRKQLVQKMPTFLITAYCKDENLTHHYGNEIVGFTNFMKSNCFLGIVDVAENANHLHLQVAPVLKGCDGSQLCHSVWHMGRLHTLAIHLCTFSSLTNLGFTTATFCSRTTFQHCNWYSVQWMLLFNTPFPNCIHN